MIISITKADRKYFQDLAETCERQEDFLLAFYAKYVPSWDDVEVQYLGSVLVSRETNLWFGGLAMKVDNRLRVGTMIGGLWFNSGPSTDEKRADWTVQIEKNKIQYKEKEAA